MEVLIKFLAISFLVFYGLKYLFRLLMPYALRKMTERLMGKAQQAQSGAGQGSYQYSNGNPFDQFKQQQQRQQSQRHEGEVRVDYVPAEDAKARKGTQTAGEFVEFEEIK